MLLFFFVLVTMFIAIIAESFKTVRADLNKQSNEHEMVEFIFDKLKQWSGYNEFMAEVRRKQGISPNKPLDEKAEKELLEAQLAQFPDSIDRFLDYISQSYFQKDPGGGMFSETGASGKDSLKAMIQAGSNGKMPALAVGKYPKPIPSPIPVRSNAALRKDLPHVD